MSCLFMPISRKVSVLLTFMLFFQISFAQYNFNEVDKFLADNQKDMGKNVAVLIYKDGKPVYKKELGEMKANEQIPIASCSKWFTAALVMTLVDEGKLNLDDKVAQYLPIFKTYGKEYITIRHCLSHQTGIKQEPFSFRAAIFGKKYTTLEELVNDIASKKEIDYNAGDGFYYGNVGLDIAARICEVVTKKSFVQLTTERLFRPLAMRGTSFANENIDRAPNPSGGAHSSAIEYSNFVTMLLNKGVYNNTRILSDTAVQQMRTQQVAADKMRYAPKAAAGYGYALGAWVYTADAYGLASSLTCPGLFGSFPLVDYCRGYTLVLFTKSLLSEHKEELFTHLKGLVDAAIAQPNCN